MYFALSCYKSRPIKITLKDHNQVRNLLSLIRRNRTNIEGNSRFKSIRVSVDRTSWQRLYDNQLKNQIKQRLENREENLFIKYVRGSNTINAVQIFTQKTLGSTKKNA